MLNLLGLLNLVKISIYSNLYQFFLLSLSAVTQLEHETLQRKSYERLSELNDTILSQYNDAYLFNFKGSSRRFQTSFFFLCGALFFVPVWFSPVLITKRKGCNVLSCRAYTSIVTLDQRQRYKADFNKSYANYRKLHNVLDEVSKRFSHLESKLKQAARGSEGSKVIINRPWVL